MSFQSATAAQRLEVRDEAAKLAKASQPWAQTGTPPSTSDGAAVDTVGAACLAALSAIGLSASLPATQAIVANGGNVNVKNSAGTVTKVGVATVAANAISGVALAAGEAIVSNAGTVAITNSASSSVAGTHTADVALGVVTRVRLAATVAPVVNAAAVVVSNSALVAVPGTHTANVAAGAITQVALAATVAAVVNGTKYNAVSVTGTGNFATFTVAAGVITAIVLSAS